ncbi:4Fe-4S binding protein [Clostridiaceae bacterium HSG29]|nr:4Fe-4S binding protein [Clostridiaceae bacterium HSG29]
MIKRKSVQAIFAISFYLIASYFQISLLYIILFGSVLGIIFGKVFCRWMCPIGYVMELMMKFSKSDEKTSLYQYHKLGCPIAWISGYLNKMSFFKIKIDQDKCIDCGKCDSACYITNFNKDASLFKKGKIDPAASYKCSRCMDCITVCPVDALSYTSK